MFRYYMAPLIRKDSDLMKRMIEDIPIPPKPGNLIECLHVMSQEEVSLQDVSKIISKDIAITAAILKTINTPFFEVSQEIISINQAITLLGLDNVRNLLLCFSLKHAFSEMNNVFLQEFWKQTTTIALFSATLASRFSTKPSDEAFTFSMLCDIAVPAIARVNEGYGDFFIQNSYSSNASIIDLEDSSYLIDHTTVGEFISNHWNLPTFLSKGIANHHNTDEYFGYELNNGNSSVIAYTALHYLAEHMYYSYAKKAVSHDWIKVQQSVYSVLGITEELIQNIKDDLFVLFEKTSASDAM